MRGLVGLIGLACASVRLPNWGDGLPCGVVLPGLAILWALPRAVRGRERSFWAGFAASGTLALSAFAFASLSGGSLYEALDSYAEWACAGLSALIPAFHPGADTVVIAGGLTVICSAPQLAFAVVAGAATRHLARGLVQRPEPSAGPSASAT